MIDLIKGELDWHETINSNFHEINSDKTGILTTLDEHTSQLNHTQNLNSKEINILYPPVPLIGAKGDGKEESDVIQNIINFAQENNIPRVLVPRPSVSYKCKKTIKIDGSKISFIGNNSFFDFSLLQDGTSCFEIISSTDYNNRDKINNQFTGITINKGNSKENKNNHMGILIHGNGDEGINNFEISYCNILLTDKALVIGENAWRISVDKCIFMWNNYHLYNSIDSKNTIENNNFTRCFFGDGEGKIDIATACAFNNCSFDNVLQFIQRNQISYIDNCHFEKIKGSADSEITYINTPFLETADFNGGLVVTNTKFIINYNYIFNCSPFKVFNNTNRGIVLESCYIINNIERFGIDNFISNNKTIALVEGNGRFKAKNIWATIDIGKSYIPISKQENLIFNGEANMSILPFDETSKNISTVTVEENGYNGNCFKCVVSPNDYNELYLILDVKPQDKFIFSLMAKINANGGTGSLRTYFKWIRSDGSESDTLGYTDITDSNGKWIFPTSNVTGIVPSGNDKIKVIIQAYNVGSEQELVIYLDDLIFNLV